MSYVLRSTQHTTPHYYRYYNKCRGPAVGTLKRAAHFELEQAKVVVRHLTQLGYNFVIMDAAEARFSRVSAPALTLVHSARPVGHDP